MLGLGLNAAAVAVLRGGPVVPAEPRDVFNASPALSLSDANANCNFRTRIVLSENMGPEWRVTIQPGADNALTSDHVAMARADGDDATANAVATLTEALFGGVAGFSAATTEQTSDWMPSGSMNGMPRGTSVILSYNTGGTGQASQAYVDGSVGTAGFFKADTTGWQDQTVSGYTGLDELNFGNLKIETRGGKLHTNPADDYIPIGFDDPIFARNTPSASPLIVGSGKNLYHRTIEEYVGVADATLKGMGTNEIQIVAVKSREAFRFAGGDGTEIAIRWAYFESVGEGEDHADTLQVYSPGGRNQTCRLENAHIKAGVTAATANWFVSNNWGGDIIVKNVVVEGGPYGLRFQADGASITISLENVYFVPPFGDLGGPYSFEDVGGATHTIVKWENVRYATIVEGVLVPGDLIPQPPLTPAELDPAVWLEPARGALFQSNAGTTAATANSDVVGYLPDLSGNGKHYTSEADNTTRPTLQGVGSKPCLRFDGSNDFLMRTASLGLLAGGAYTLAFAFKSNTPATDARFFTEGNTASNNTLFIPLQAHNPTATTSSALYRNDAGTQLVSPSSMTNTNVFNNTDKVLILTDDGTFIRTYVNGVAGASTGWTPSGVFTLNRSAIGCLLRAAAGNWWAGDIYGMVAIPRVLTDDERASLTTYMGNLAGLSI